MGHLGTGVSTDVNPGNAFKANLRQYLSLSLQSYHVEALLQEGYLAEVHVLQKQLGRSSELHAATYSEWCSRK